MKLTTEITRDILSEAKNLAHFANHSEISENEVEVASKRVMSNIEFNSQTTLEAIKESSESINNQPLPPIKSYTGLKFPHDRNNLTAPNFEVKTRKELEEEAASVDFLIDIIAGLMTYSLQKANQLSYAQPQFITRNVNAINSYTIQK